jgi:hypothetical protein
MTGVIVRYNTTPVKAFLLALYWPQRHRGLGGKRKKDLTTEATENPQSARRCVAGVIEGKAQKCRLNRWLERTARMAVPLFLLR